jgi:hypothetical protein
MKTRFDLFNNFERIKIKNFFTDREPFFCRLHQSEAGVAAAPDQVVRDQHVDAVRTSLLSNLYSRIRKFRRTQTQVWFLTDCFVRFYINKCI